MNELIFFAAAAVVLLGSVLVFVLRNTVYAVVSLIVALSAVAVLFFQLGAAFIGALQVILYAGAIMVLFLFVVMLLHVRRDDLGPDRHGLQKAVAILAGFVLVGQFVLLGRGVVAGVRAAEPTWGSTAALAESFFSRFVLAFELTSLLLLAAMVGAVLIARRASAGGRS